MVQQYYQLQRQQYAQQLYQIQQTQQQRQYPQQRPAFHSPPRPDIVECPGSNDVIFRRGKSMTYHPGNVMFQSLIEARLDEHTKATQTGKLAIVSELINTIRVVKGGRFLTWDAKHNWWLDMVLPSSVPISVAAAQAQDLEIQSKVNYAFRDFKKKKKTAQNLQISRCSTYAFERQDGHERKRVKGGAASKNQCCGFWGCGGSDSSNNVVSDGGE